MEREMINQDSGVEAAETNWHSLYRVAGVGALIAVGFVLLDIVLSFTGGDVAVGGLSATDWFAYFQSNWFLGLRNLGFFNVINLTLTIPLYLALYRLHRRAAPAYAALALILYLLGAAIYASNNRALSMLALSDQYAAAPSEAQKTLLVTAGTVILAQAEDFTPGTFLGFLLSSIASLAMMAVMLTGRIFNKWIALTGLIGTSFLLVFTISATFGPEINAFAMIFALVGGLLMLAWNSLIVMRLFRMRGAASKQGAQRGMSAPLTTTGKGM